MNFYDSSPHSDEADMISAVSTHAGWTVVEISGDLDVVSGGPLGVALAKMLASRPVAVDCSHLGLVDSTGLRSIVRANNAAREYGVAFCLVSVPSLLERLLSITKLDGILSVASSVADLGDA